VNEAASLVNRGIAAFVSALEKLAAKAAKVEFPWLNLPIISTIFDFFLGLAMKRLTHELQTTGTFLVIDFQTSRERDEYLGSIQALREAKASGNSAAHRAALERARKAADDLIQWNGRVLRL
jgi:hypothetical protein